VPTRRSSDLREFFQAAAIAGGVVADTESGEASGDCHLFLRCPACRTWTAPGIVTQRRTAGAARLSQRLAVLFVQPRQTDASARGGRTRRHAPRAYRRDSRCFSSSHFVAFAGS